MTRMPNFEQEIKRDLQRTAHAVSSGIEHLTHHALPSQTPATRPVTVDAAPAAPPEENPMSLLDTLKTDVADVEAKLKDVDEDALTKLNAVMANPEASAVLNDLAGLASIVGIPPGTISGVATGLKTVLSLYAPDPTAAPAQAPAVAPVGQ